MKLTNASHFGPCKRGEPCNIATPGAAVVTMIVAGVVAGTPVVVTDDGLNWQAAAAGSPEQDSVMVPLNPVEEETLNDVCPETPGAEITIVDGEGFVG